MSFIRDFQEESKRQTNRGRCLHHSSGTRCNEIISAHSIQNKGQLSLIAEVGHVYRLGADLSTLKRTGGLPEPMKIGIKKASTFDGFCKLHDNALFEPIDNFALRDDKRQVALYAYRSLCREYFVKENAATVMTKMMAHPDLAPSKRSFLKSFQLGQSLGFASLQQHKKLYDEALLAQDYDQFEFLFITSRDQCNVQVSGLLFPDFDFVGKQLQDLSEWESVPSLITFFTAPTADGWAFGFAWHASSNKACIPFIESLAARVRQGEKPQDALLRFAISACENHAIRISWWDGLDPAAKSALIERMRFMTAPHTAIAPDYLASGCEGIANWEFEYVHTTLQPA
jgi:hypothetical protein